MQKLIGFPILLFFLSGCYQTSLAPMIGPATGVSQGRIAYSAVSTSVSYGVKHKTGKYPIEHIFKREKDKIVNKIASIEKEVIKNSVLVKEKLVSQKDNLKIKDKASKKLRWVLHVKEIKNVTQEEVFSANKPRYSYWSKQK
tara:strand:+ start:1497 stop:1922 length:426 start_codon:yes stop_codon:yes gene_type:complete